jgi:hypothetical protein
VVNEILKDNNGKWSLKRILALFGSICFFIKLFNDSSPAIVDACMYIVIIGIGATTAEKFKKG